MRGLLASVYSPPPARRPWRLEDLLGGAAVRYYSFARRALAEGLRAAGVGEGQTVLLPEFICRDLLSALAAVGARPAFYPVDRRLAPAREPERWPEARAVVAVNYFGFPADLEPFRRYCARRRALLIEDNAHGLFSRDRDGRALGTRADLGLFSLRKSLPLPNGAALALPDGGRWTLPPQGGFARAGSPRHRLKQASRLLARLGPAAAFRGLSMLRGLKRPPRLDEGAEDELPVPGSPCAQLAKPIRAADPELEAARRRSLYRLIGETLEPAGFAPVFEALAQGTVPYAYAFRSSKERLPEASRLLAGLGLACLHWPDLPSTIEAAAPSHYRDVRLVHFLW